MIDWTDPLQPCPWDIEEPPTPMPVWFGALLATLFVGFWACAIVGFITIAGWIL